MRRWKFECWNEPNLSKNIFGSFWSGTKEQYFALYNATAVALKRADSHLQVGGPASSGGGWLADFLTFVRGHSDSHSDSSASPSPRPVPLDFISTHHYPGTTGAGLEQLEECLKNDQALVQSLGFDPHTMQLSEYNSGLYERILPFHNHDTSYAGAFVATLLPRLSTNAVVEKQQIMSYWSFSDVFEEIYFDHQPFHDGFGLITIHGIPKPAFRAFELLHLLPEGENVTLSQVAAESNTIHVMGTSDDQNLVSVLLTNFQNHNASMSIQPTQASWNVTVALLLDGHADVEQEEQQPKEKKTKVTRRSFPSKATLYRVDADHANGHSAWVAMGKPMSLTSAQLESLMHASELEKEEVEVRVGSDDEVDEERTKGGWMTLTKNFSETILLCEVVMVPQSVAFLQIQL